MAADIARKDRHLYDAAWMAYMEACDRQPEVGIPFGAAFDAGVKLEPKLTETFTEVNTFLANDCKSYNDSRNSPEKLAAFIPRLQQVSAKISESRELGLNAGDNLKKSLVGHDRLHQKLGLDPRRSSCRTKLLERTSHVEARTALLMQKVTQIKTLCPVAETNEPKAITAKNKNVGAGSPAPTEAELKNGRSPASESTISGTKQAIEDATKGSAVTK